MDTRADGAAEMEEDDQRQEGHRDNDPNDDDDPPWRPAGRSSFGAPVRVIGRLGGAGRIVHRASSCSCVLAVNILKLSRQAVYVKPDRPNPVGAYTPLMPKLWTETIETHRREVRDAILDTTAALVAEQGLLAVTMSQIAEETGIGRATLYKYFPDVEAILLAWHDRQVAAHLAYLAEVRDQASGVGDRLEAVLEAYALLSRHSRGHQDAGFADLLHRDDQIGRAQRQVHDMIRDLLAAAATAGDVRSDVPSDELASYCVHSLGGVGGQRSKSAVRRLVSVTMDGLRPPH
jgi:AcrR family transcriptional regulator